MDIYKKLTTNIGPLYLIVSKDGLKFLGFKKPAGFKSYSASDASEFQLGLLSKIEKEIGEYINGTRENFSIALDLVGTDFQKLVWSNLAKIPFAKTVSYKDLAVAVGCKNGARAVGNANGKNPVCIIIPCHRVIASDGSLGGYSGGLDNKIKLLNIEKIVTRHP